MNLLLKLGLPLVLGLIAGGLNWYVLKSKTEPSVYVKMKEDLAAGKPFTEDNLAPLSITGDEGSLKGSAVRYSDRAVLYDRPSPRDLKAGDIVFLRDATPPPSELTLAPGEDALPVPLEGMSVVPSLLAVGDVIGFVVAASPSATPPAAPGGARAGRPAEESAFRYIGPFRILSVGARLIRQDADRKTTSGDDRVITVAIKLEGDDKKPDEKARRLLEALKARRDGQQRFVEIVLHATRKP